MNRFKPNIWVSLITRGRCCKEGIESNVEAKDTDTELFSIEILTGWWWKYLQGGGEPNVECHIHDQLSTC